MCLCVCVCVLLLGVCIACVCVCVCVCVSKVMKQHGDNRQLSDLCSHFLLVSLDHVSLCISISLLFQSEQNRNALRQSFSRSPTIVLCVSYFALLRQHHLSLRSGVKLLTTSSLNANNQLTFSLGRNWSKWPNIDYSYIIYTSNLTHETSFRTYLFYYQQICWRRAGSVRNLPLTQRFEWGWCSQVVYNCLEVQRLIKQTHH